MKFRDMVEFYIGHDRERAKDVRNMASDYLLSSFFTYAFIGLIAVGLISVCTLIGIYFPNPESTGHPMTSEEWSRVIAIFAALFVGMFLGNIFGPMGTADSIAKRMEDNMEYYEERRAEEEDDDTVVRTYTVHERDT